MKRLIVPLLCFVVIAAPTLAQTPKSAPKQQTSPTPPGEPVTPPTKPTPVPPQTPGPIGGKPTVLPPPVADEPKPAPAPRVAMPAPAAQPASVSPFIPLTPAPAPTPVSQEPVPPFTTADYVHRAMLSGDSNFSGRVMVALLDVTDAVLREPPSSAEYDTRLKFVATVMREPDFAARRMTRLVAANLPNVQVDSLGRAFTTATDKEIYDYVMSLWTPLAKSMAAFP